MNRLPTDLHVLADAGRTPYRIVIPAAAAPAEETAARELREHFRAITAAELPVVPDSAAPQAHEIVLGRANRAEPRDAGLGPEAFRIRTDGTRLRIAGGSPRGTLYGVYEFLQRQLGCRWYAPGVERVPRQDRVAVGPLDEWGEPAFEYRNFILDGLDREPAWSARNALNGINGGADAAHGGRRTHWNYGHSFFALLPPDRYFREHPEYFDLTSRGKATVDDHINPCGTHPEVARIAADNLSLAIEAELAAAQKDPAHPAPDFYYLAQNDGGTPCTCPECRKLIEAEGTLAAPVLHLCNRVADTVSRRFPGTRFITIAYRFSRRPPRTLRAHPSLIVQLCGIECCQSHPRATCEDPDSVRFREDLDGWRRAADQLWIWDYMPRLWHPFLTGPGFEPLAANLRWFHERGVRGMFQQTGGERDLKWLNAWLMARCMSDPYRDWQADRDEFLAAYYGPAAAPIRAFLALVHDSVERGRHHLRYKEGAVKPFLSADVIREGSRLWAAAEDAVRGEPDRLARVRDERMHFLCTRLQHAAHHSVCSAASLRGGRLHVERPAAVQAEAREFVAWRQERYGAAAPTDDTLFVESDLVRLDSGRLELEFLPCLAGRLVGCRLRDAAHNLIHCVPAADGAFDPAGGYHERWIAAPVPYEDEGRSSWGFRKAREAARGAAEAGSEESVALAAIGDHHLFETGGKFVHPMQWERWTRLAVGGTAFHIESLIVNRGIGTEDAAVETCLPLDLGDPAGVTLSIPRLGWQDRSLTGQAQEFVPSDLAEGLVLASAALGVAVHWRPAGEVIGAVRLAVDVPQRRVVLKLRTQPTLLTPGAGRRFCQFVEIRGAV